MTNTLPSFFQYSTPFVFLLQSLDPNRGKTEETAKQVAEGDERDQERGVAGCKKEKLEREESKQRGLGLVMSEFKGMKCIMRAY